MANIPSRTGTTQQMPTAHDSVPPAELAAMWGQVKLLHDQNVELHKQNKLLHEQNMQLAKRVDELHVDMRALNGTVTRALEALHRGSRDDLKTARDVADLRADMARHAAEAGTAAGKVAGEEAGRSAGKRYGWSAIAIAAFAALTSLGQCGKAALEKNEEPFKLKPFVNEPSQRRQQD